MKPTHKQIEQRLTLEDDSLESLPPAMFLRGRPRTALDDEIFAEMTRAAAEFANAAFKAAKLHPPNFERFGNGLTMKELGQLSRIHPGTVSAVINADGRYLASLMTLARMARASGKRLKLVLGD